MATTADFKNGLVLKNEGKLQQIIEFQHVKPGKGPAFVRTKLKDVVTGKTIDKTWNAGVKVETATVDRRDVTYLYNDGTSFIVMDDKTFEQYELSPDAFGDAGRFLLENMRVQVSFHEARHSSANSQYLSTSASSTPIQACRATAPPAAPSQQPSRPALKSRSHCSSRPETYSR